MNLPHERNCGCVERLHKAVCIVTCCWIEQNSDDGALGDTFVKHFQPLCFQIVTENQNASGITAGTVDARHKSSFHRVAARYEYDGD